MIYLKTGCMEYTNLKSSCSMFTDECVNVGMCVCVHMSTHMYTYKR